MEEVSICSNIVTIITRAQLRLNPSHPDGTVRGLADRRCLDNRGERTSNSSLIIEEQDVNCNKPQITSEHLGLTPGSDISQPDNSGKSLKALSLSFHMCTREILLTALCVSQGGGTAEQEKVGVKVL